MVLVAAIPLLVGWMRRSPDVTPKVLLFMGFLPWALDFHLYMAIISWVEWPGFVKGVEFTVLDALALAVYFSLPRVRYPRPFRISMVLYFAAVFLSVFQASVPMASLFYLWQLARMFLVYAAVARACVADPRAAPALMSGMVAGLFFQAGVVIWERVALGILQAGGTEGHQNLLGLMSHFVVFPCFALLLTRERRWLAAVGTLAGVVVQVLTTSRATIGLAVFGYAAVFLLSAVRYWTLRKALVLLIGVATVAALAPAVIFSFERRFAVPDYGNYDERAALEKAAAMILSDYPLGVGANQYVTVAITEGYSAKAGVAPTLGSMTAHVHNIYWLVAAETGYLGLTAFVLLLLRPITVAFLCGWRHKGDPRGDLLLGLGVALLVVYIHSFFEWIFISSQVQYMFALELGLIAALAHQLGYWRQPSYRRRRLYRQETQLGIEPLESGPKRNIR
jgi:O-antigen ligase